jgi:hypothetical protein
MDYLLQDILYKMAKVRPEVSRFLQVARLIGEFHAAALCDELGGRDIAIPRMPETNAPFDRLLGKKLAAAIKEQFGGQTVYVPCHFGLGRSQRDADIRGRRAAGCTIAELATRFQLSERRIRQIVSTHEPD